MSENGQNIRPGFMDDMFLGFNPETMNDPEKIQAARLFIQAIVAHEIGNKKADEAEIAPDDYIGQLRAETREKALILLTGSRWDFGLAENTNIVKTGREITGILTQITEEDKAIK